MKRQKSARAPAGTREEVLLGRIQGLDTQGAELLLLHAAHSASDPGLTPAGAKCQPAQANSSSAAPVRGGEISRETQDRTSAACWLRGALPPPFPRAISSGHVLHAAEQLVSD